MKDKTIKDVDGDKLGVGLSDDRPYVAVWMPYGGAAHLNRKQVKKLRKALKKALKCEAVQ